MNIFLIRHGETDKSQSLSDWQYPITEKGHRQAIIAGEFLRDFFKNNNLDVNKTTIISSPYVRTTQTCEHISDIFDVSPSKIFQIAEYQEGLDYKTPQQFFPTGEESKILTQIFNKSTSQQINVNESSYEIILRAKQFLQQLNNIKTENVIIVTHNGFMRAFDVVFNNLPIREYYKSKKIRNCSIMHYEIGENEHINHGEILTSTKDYQIPNCPQKQ